MRKILLLGLVLLSNNFLRAQDEGAVVKRERIQRDKNIFIGGGASIVGGSNFGDYSTGINFEGGYSRRLNRVLTIGGSVSYLSFNYDQSILQKPPAQYEDPVNFYYGYDANSNEIGSQLFLNGGDIRMLSFCANLKLNFVPVRDNSVISIYAFAKPFFSIAKLSDLSGTSKDYLRNPNGDWGLPISNSSYNYKGDSKISGGILLGPGIELFPAKKISFFAQASFGYTFPIEIVSTRSYNSDIENLSDSKFPKSSLGFTSINFAGGVSYNID